MRERYREIEIMENEIKNFIMVCSSILISACYCYGISKLVPKGTTRLFMFLPVLCLFVLLPLHLNFVNLILPTAFYVTWLSSFKLLLFAFGTGPLSYPSLSLFHFALIFCLPIKLQQAPSPNFTKEKGSIKRAWNKDNNLLNRKSFKVGRKSTLHNATKGLIFFFLMGLGYHKDKFPRDIVLFLTCIFVYIGLQISLEFVTSISRLLLGMQIEPPFDQPYLSTSFQEFWGRRWNRVALSSLRSTVFDPTRYHTSRVLGRKWANMLALLVTFIVSAVMHEIIFYYLGRVRPGWGSRLFFLVQGLCVVIESTLMRKYGFRWQLPQNIIGPLIFGFLICTFMWLALPEVMEHNVVDRALQEYAALGLFVKELGLTWVEMGYDLLVKVKVFGPTTQN